MLLPAVPSAALGRWLLATASLAGRPSLAAHYAHADIENAMSATSAAGALADASEARQARSASEASSCERRLVSSRRSRSDSRSCACMASASLAGLCVDLPLFLPLLEWLSLRPCWRGGSGAFGVRGWPAESHGDFVGSAGAVGDGAGAPEFPGTSGATMSDPSLRLGLGPRRRVGRVGSEYPRARAS